MSAYLSLYKIKNSIINDDTFITYKMPDDIFDEGKWCWDWEFISENEFDYLYTDDPEIVYRRPKDIGRTIKWVEENIKGEGNKDRLLSALKLMKNSKDYYFCFV